MNGGILINITENQKKIRDALSRKSKMVKAEKLFKELEKELELKNMSQFIRDLNALERAGEVIVSKKGNVQSIAGAGLVRGTVVSMAKHFAFVRPESGEEDIYISREQNSGALPGDKVVMSVRSDKKGPSGNVLSIFERGDHRAVGVLKKFHGRLEFHADSLYKTPIDVIKNKINAREGDKVQAKIILSKDGKTLSCIAEKIYGNAESARVCADAIIDDLGVPHEFDEEVLNCAEEIGLSSITPSDMCGRTDLRAENIFTIDGADAKDLDDAICVKKTEKGFELSVHIADVSYYVKDGSPLDREAFERGTSVYFADRVIPMYPEAISNGVCSLNANTDKLTFSAFMSFDSEGNMLSSRFAKTIINSRVRGVYSEVNQILDGSADSHIEEKYASVRAELEAGYELYKLLRDKSDKRGSIHFSSTETSFVLDESGVCIGLKPRETGEAEKMIEQFMIAANTAAAALARREVLPFVYRVHESPDPDALDGVARLLGLIGVNAAVLRGKPSSADVDSILTAVKGTQYEQVVSNAMLRAMSKARYDCEPLGHFGLALGDYCHFTSPIRRYPDSFIHRILSAYVTGQKQSSIMKKFIAKAEDAAEASSKNELRAVNAERRTESCYMAEYMSSFIGDEFDGTICSVIESGFFVRLPNSAEGFVRFQDLPDDSYKFDGFATLRGENSGVKYTVGDNVRVCVAAARVSIGKVDFVLAEDKRKNTKHSFEEIK